MSEQERYWRIEQRVNDLLKSGVSKHAVFNIIAKQILKDQL